MANVVFGSARHDENGKLVNGKAGDQLQKSSTNDTTGEVSMQPYYLHSKGWVVLRPKSVAHAEGIASKMVTACNNPNIGYDQNQRTGVITNGISSKVKTETDCSVLVRACVKEATGIDPGNFTTINEADSLLATGLFEPKLLFKSLSATPLYVGDVLVTKTKGHTVVVVGGNHRSVPVAASQGPKYPKYTGTSTSIITALKTVGETDTTLAHRAKIAAANKIANYTGTSAQNNQMLNLLKSGVLVKPIGAVADVGGYYPACKKSTASLVAALAEVGEKDTSFTHRKKIAAANGVTNYTGTEPQNVKLIGLLRSGKLIKA